MGYNPFLLLVIVIYLLVVNGYDGYYEMYRRGALERDTRLVKHRESRRAV
jgi:hypothetical protein